MFGKRCNDDNIRYGPRDGQHLRFHGRIAELERLAHLDIVVELVTKAKLGPFEVVLALVVTLLEHSNLGVRHRLHDVLGKDLGFGQVMRDRRGLPRVLGRVIPFGCT